MHRVEPKVHVIGQTTVDEVGLRAYLEDIGAVGWESDAPSDVEEIIEVNSRGCYMSFGTDLNPNITRVRGSNKEHLANVIKTGHGSVMEHSFVNFQFTNVSRVFTHELVRHRVGVAISQQSLRYVRLEDLGLWIPSCFADYERAVTVFQLAWMTAENAYATLIQLAAEKEGVQDFNDLPFGKKKEYTSAARRVAPDGLATNIGWSCNIRELRHIIGLRTDEAAEEEIRLVFGQVKEIALERWPNLFQDF